MRKAGVIVGALWLIGCGSPDDKGSESAPVVPAGFGSTWAEFLTPAALTDALPLLHAHSVTANVAWPAAKEQWSERLDLAEAAEARGVQVDPWLLLDDADGYWPGSTNALSFRDSAVALMDAWSARGLQPTTLIVDMELRKDRADELSSLLGSETSDLPGVVELLRSGVDEKGYAEATSIYRDLVDEAHDRGFRVHLTTLPQVLDDYADGDDDLRQAFGIPVEGIEWDSVSFQAYRTLFGDLLGASALPSAYFVYSYGRDAMTRFGERAGLDVGLVGEGVTASSTYGSGADLAADLGAARAAGVPRDRVVVYNLDGILERTPTEQWLEDPAGELPAQDEATVSIRGQVALLDSILLQ